MVPSNTDYGILPNYYPFLIPNFSAMTFPSWYPSPQQQGIPNPLLPSHVHASPMLGVPLHHAEPLTLAPPGALLTTHIHDHHGPQPVLAHRPSVSEPSLQIAIGVPNIEARGGAAATYEYQRYYPRSYGAQSAPRSPILTNQAISTIIGPTPMSRPPTRIRVTTHPYTRVRSRKKTHPATEYTPDMGLVLARCVAEGGDPAAINLLRVIFPDNISIKALSRRMTRHEARQYNHGVSGPMYRVFLRIDEGNRFHCRLCAADADGWGWKQAKDTLRHLKRDHFGLGTCCDRCGKIFYTTGELTRHRCGTPRGF